MNRSKCLSFSLIVLLGCALPAIAAADVAPSDSRSLNDRSSGVEEKTRAEAPARQAGTEGIQKDKLGDTGEISKTKKTKKTTTRRGLRPRHGQSGVPLGQTEAGVTTGKVTICHKPGTSAEKTLDVPMSALQDHLGHGDFTGECGDGETPVTN